MQFNLNWLNLNFACFPRKTENSISHECPVRDFVSLVVFDSPQTPLELSQSTIRPFPHRNDTALRNRKLSARLAIEAANPADDTSNRYPLPVQLCNRQFRTAITRRSPCFGRENASFSVTPVPTHTDTPAIGSTHDADFSRLAILRPISSDDRDRLESALVFSEQGNSEQILKKDASVIPFGIVTL